jgi:hypothetical protein
MSLEGARPRAPRRQAGLQTDYPDRGPSLDLLS